MIQKILIIVALILAVLAVLFGNVQGVSAVQLLGVGLGCVAVALLL